MLGQASGYPVFDLRGRRVGFVIGLVDDPESGERRLAIRRDGVFLWRRQLLPLEAVESADARRLFVVVDDRPQPPASDDATAPARAAQAAPDADAEPSFMSRVAFYTHPPTRAETADAEPVLDRPEAAERPAPVAVNHHLRFVSAPDGYHLSDREGEPPAVGTRISGTDLPEPLVVVKIGPSPLPSDSRVCVFLERDNPLATPPTG